MSSKWFYVSSGVLLGLGLAANGFWPKAGLFTLYLFAYGVGCYLDRLTQLSRQRP